MNSQDTYIQKVLKSQEHFDNCPDCQREFSQEEWLDARWKDGSKLGCQDYRRLIIPWESALILEL